VKERIERRKTEADITGEGVDVKRNREEKRKRRKEGNGALYPENIIINV
jgi:hypothetical protein